MDIPRPILLRPQRNKQANQSSGQTVVTFHEKKRENPFAVVSESEIKMLNTDAVPRNTKAFVFQEIHKIYRKRL